MMFRIVGVVAVLLGVAACGGGGSGDSTPVVTYVVTATTDLGASISPTSVSVESGQTATFTVTAKAGFAVNSVSGCGGSFDGSHYVTAAVYAPCTVAVATLATYSVDVAADPHLSVVPNSASVMAGMTATFKIKADSGYVPLFVTGCGGTLTGDTYTVGPLQTHCTVYATATGVADPIVRSGYGLNSLNLAPRALFQDEFAGSPVTLEIAVSNPQGLRFFVEYFDKWFAVAAPGMMTRIPLYDDGTHGDKVAGDGIYTAQFSPNILARLRFHDQTADYLPLSVNAYDAAGNAVPSTTSTLAQVYLGVIDKKMSVSAQPVGTGVSATPNVLILETKNYQADPEFYGSAMKKVYLYYPDVFDGFVMHTFGSSPTISAAGKVFSNIPLSLLIKSDAQGTNMPIFDGSSAWGSQGLLRQGSVMQGDILGQSLMYDMGGFYIRYLNQPALDLVSPVSATWPSGPVTTLIGQGTSSMYLQEQSNGDFLVENTPDKTVYFGRQFADLELYLMGLAPASQVGPQYFVFDPAVDTRYHAIVPRAKATKVTIDDIQRIYGVRSPSSDQTKKAFRYVYIALTDRPLTAAEIAIIHRNAVYYAGQSQGGVQDDAGLFPAISYRSFYSATKGFGSLSTTLPPLK